MAFIHVSREQREADELDLARRQKRAYAICACDLGRLADSERWLPALVQDVTETGRLPHAGRYGILRGKSADSDDGIQLCADEAKGSRNSLAPMLDRFRKVMLDRASKDVFGVTAMKHDLILPAVVMDRSAHEANLERLRGEPRVTELSDSARRAFNVRQPEMEAAE